MNSYGINPYANIQKESYNINPKYILIIEKANRFGVEIFKNRYLLESMLNLDIKENSNNDYEIILELINSFEDSIEAAQMSNK
jgi:hypothetical protein